MELVGGGSVINGATPSSLLSFQPFHIFQAFSRQFIMPSHFILHYHNNHLHQQCNYTFQPFHPFPDISLHFKHFPTISSHFNPFPDSYSHLQSFQQCLAISSYFQPCQALISFYDHIISSSHHPIIIQFLHLIHCPYLDQG